MVVPALIPVIVLFWAVVLVVRKPWVEVSANGNVADQLPAAFAVTTFSDCSASLIESVSSRKISMMQLGQGLLVPAVPATAVPLMLVTAAGLKFRKASGKLLVI